MWGTYRWGPLKIDASGVWYPTLYPSVRAPMSLKATEIKYLQCPDDKKEIKRSDGNGLSILVRKNGSKLWRFRYKYASKHQDMALGSYPDVSLSDARKLAVEAKSLLNKGINPIKEKKKHKQEFSENKYTFREVAEEWLEKKFDISAPSYSKYQRIITNDLKTFSRTKLDDIEHTAVVDFLISLGKKGSRSKAPIVLSVLQRVRTYALHVNYTKKPPYTSFKIGEIMGPAPASTPMPAILDLPSLSILLKDIEDNPFGDFISREALKLIPHIFVRPVEMRRMRWEYVDFEQKLIVIPAKDTKRDRDFLIPMSKQVIEKLRSVRQVTGYSDFIFPNERDTNKGMSKNVLTNRLRDLGYPADVMSAHGFRSIASTTLRETVKVKKDAIELQLSHLIGSSTTRAYDRAQYLTKRKKMMQKWSDFLDDLRKNA